MSGAPQRSPLTAEDILIVTEEMLKFWTNAGPALTDTQLLTVVTNLFLQTCYRMVEDYPRDLKVESRLAEAIQGLALLVLQHPYTAKAGGVPYMPGNDTVN